MAEGTPQGTGDQLNKTPAGDFAAPTDLTHIQTLFEQGGEEALTAYFSQQQHVAQAYQRGGNETVEGLVDEQLGDGHTDTANVSTVAPHMSEDAFGSKRDPTETPTTSVEDGPDDVNTSEQQAQHTELHLSEEHILKLGYFHESVSMLEQTATAQEFEELTQGVVEYALQSALNETSSDESAALRLAVACEALGAYKGMPHATPSYLFDIIQGNPLLGENDRATLTGFVNSVQWRHTTGDPHDFHGDDLDDRKRHRLFANSNILVDEARAYLWALDTQLGNEGRWEEQGNSKEPLRLALLAYIAGESVQPRGQTIDGMAGFNYLNFARGLKEESAQSH